MRFFSALFIAICLLAVSCVHLNREAGSAHRFYVSPNGNDAWSGRLAKPNHAENDGPFATIQAARDHVRALRQKSALAGNVEVLILGGVYEISEPLTFTPEDSGTTGSVISYIAYPGEKPVISGGRVITGWTKTASGVWETKVSEAFGASPCFSQLFVNGQRRQPARIPNTGYLKTVGRVPLSPIVHSDAPPWDYNSFQFQPGDIKPWANLNDVNIVVMGAFEVVRMRIGSVDETNNIVHSLGAPCLEMWLSGTVQNRSYYIENVKEGLDAPGEWYLDRATGVLSYMPMPGEEIGATQVIAPVVKKLLVLAGEPDSGKLISHLSFDGLTFSYSDWELEKTGHGDCQAAHSVEAAVEADGVSRVAFRRCTVSHVGTYGIWFRRGCMNNMIKQCEIADTGAGGVRIAPMNISRQIDHSDGNTLANSYIHDGGHVYPGAIGVLLGAAAYTTVAHNEICDHQYSGISSNWVWGYGPSNSHHNRIEYNHIHHLGQGILHDMGGIYLLGVQPGTVVRNNLLHDVQGGGIYPDEGSANELYENNIAYNCLNGGFTLHYGKDNMVRNNIFANNFLYQVVRHRREEHSGFRFENNIVYYGRGELIKGSLGELREDFDKNVYWKSDGGKLIFPGTRTFQQWQEQGKDLHSVIADPLFVDPAKGDFRLREDSPALKLGFKQIDMSQVGLIGPREWRDLPLQTKREPLKLEFPKSNAPLALDETYENMPLGSQPRMGTIYGAGKGASVLVSDEAAATGKKSLKFIDQPGLQYSYQPFLTFYPWIYQGEATQSFSLKMEKGANVWVEWRNEAKVWTVGPTISIDSDGKVFSEKQDLGIRVPLGQWFSMAIKCKLGDTADGKWELTVAVPGQDAKVMTLACPGFRDLGYFHVVSNSNDHSVFYLDDLKFGVKE